MKKISYLIDQESLKKYKSEIEIILEQDCCFSGIVLVKNIDSSSAQDSIENILSKLGVSASNIKMSDVEEVEYTEDNEIENSFKKQEEKTFTLKQVKEIINITLLKLGISPMSVNMDDIL